MKAKHTPGPWVKNYDGHGARSIETEDGGRQICYVRNEDNARLISAAPDLLEAVETLLDCFVNDPLGWMDSSDIAIEKAYDAIHKAKGE